MRKMLLTVVRALKKGLYPVSPLKPKYVALKRPDNGEISVI